MLIGILRQSGFLVMSGPVGSGKTTLLNTFLYLVSTRKTEYSKINSALVVNPLLTREELLEYILDEFEIPCQSTSKPRRLNALREFLLKQKAENALSVLIIDEAHLMTFELLEEIRLLSNLDTMEGKLLQIVLCGQPELHASLSRPELLALKQRIAVTAQLRPLSEAETKTYMEDRMRTAGLATASPFSLDAVQQIHRTSGGIPRLINLISDHSLLLAFTTGKRAIGTDIVKTVIHQNGFSNGHDGDLGPGISTTAVEGNEVKISSSLKAGATGTR